MRFHPPFHTPNSSFAAAVVKLGIQVSCHHLLSSTRSVLLRDGSGFAVSHMESPGNPTGTCRALRITLPMPDMIQGPCDGGLETKPLPWASDGWLLIAGVTKSTLPLTG